MKRGGVRPNDMKTEYNGEAGVSFPYRGGNGSSPLITVFIHQQLKEMSREK